MILDNSREKTYTGINYLIFTLITLENVRLILYCLNFSKPTCCNIVPLLIINILFAVSFYLMKIKSYDISKHIFSSSLLLLFIWLCFSDISFFLKKEIIIAFPLLLIVSFKRRRYIFIYSAALLFVIYLLQKYYTVYNNIEYSIILFTVTLLSSIAFIYKLYNEKLNKIEVESYYKLYDTTFSLLGRISELKDDETQYHQERVGIIIKILLKRMKKSSRYSKYITKDFIKDVINGSFLHDIGKIAIGDSILLKSGKYNINEYEEMKKHTIIGAEILIETRNKSGINIYDTAVDIVKYHHEKWDGTGYPDGLKGQNIPLSARIMAVADVYDALISKRRYKKAFSHEDAYSIIVENSSKHFDPDIVKIFKKTHRDIYSSIRRLL